jgi:putative transposase
MPNFRRLHVPGGTYFFTVTLAARGSSLLTERIDDLRAAYAEVAALHPFSTDAIVVLPDHLHAVWTLPEGDADFSTRWKKIKTRFSWAMQHGGLSPTLRPAPSKRAKGEAGFWQRRFWEHAIRDQSDFDAHVRYCLENPVKHGFVKRPEDWPYSSIHRDIRAGRFDWM